MDKPSNENQEKVLNFQVMPSFKLFHLKQSFLPLSDLEFNPHIDARVDISQKGGVEFTVRNRITKVVGHLHLDPSLLLNYHCSKDVVGKSVDVSQVDRILGVAVRAEHSVTIFHIDGSDELSITYGSNPDEKYHVELEEDMVVETERFPQITMFCEAILTSDNLREVIKHLENTHLSTKVSVEIECSHVTLVVEGKSWVLEYNPEKVAELQPGQKFGAFFNMDHLKALKKASFSAGRVLLSFLSEPVDNVMMRFCLQDLGELVFIYQVTWVIKSSQEEIGSSSNTKPEVISFQLTPVLKLQQLMSSLCDNDFNPRGLGRLDISNEGFKITVHNPKTSVVAHLLLKPSALIDFKCSWPITGKFFNVVIMHQIVIDATRDGDSVTISHIDESNKLTFILGREPDTEYHVDFFKLAERIGRFPAVRFSSEELVLPSDSLRQMIERLKKSGMSANEVSVGIEVIRNVTFLAHGKDSVNSGKVFRSRMLITHHLNALKKASSCTEHVLVSFLSEHVMMRFCLQEFGDLMFKYNATWVVENSQELEGSGSQEKETVIE